jgi:penicillin G amidase
MTMTDAAAKRLRLLASALSVIVLLALLLVGWFIWRLRESRPQLEGTAKVTGLSAGVTVARDALGVPTIRARNRADAARALGWLHAQDRYFQMDLLRRNAAGELAELFGTRALPHDRNVRMHGFRALAREVVSRLPVEQRAIVDAYTAGVNAGLAALPERPFEYLVLRERPEPWRAEDTFLIVYTMTLDLQDGNGRYERTLMTLRDELGLGAVAFFNPLVMPTDAALDGTQAPLPAIPSARAIDLRTKKTATQTKAGRVARPALSFAVPDPDPNSVDPFPFAPRDPEAVLGSNAFALAGAHTASGAAMLANDMHLDHGVPNIWYRASLEFDGRKITGVTLPGTPAIVAGSNGNVAWGFTDAYADVSDLVVVEPLPGLSDWYAAPGKPDGIKLEQRHEVIRVKGSADVVIDYPWTIWGPIVGKNDAGRLLALHWVAHDPAATDLGLIGMEDARNVAEAIDVAHRAKMPAQNILLADRAGDIAWTIAGPLPRRVGYDGRLPVSWAFGDRRWDGYWPPDEVPVVTTKGRGRPDELAAPDGRLWSANQRQVGGAALAKIGDGDYARPYRAGQIRDDLAPLERATPRDLLAVQLDTKALFLAPWHQLFMQTLSPAVTAQKKSRASLRAFAEKWEGQASVDAVSYRLVREFRTAVMARAFPPIFASCVEQYPQFAWRDLQLEPAIWTLLREKPPHLLNPEFNTWDELLVAAADDVIGLLDKQGVTLPQANWGWRNRARIRHPFGNLLPDWISGWLNMPADPLPGDEDMPRVQSPGHGASERLVVSPGHETEGIFHMPCGQSAHPLSPYYRAGHGAWVRGEPTPFLPGKTEHTLTLAP